MGFTLDDLNDEQVKKLLYQAHTPHLLGLLSALSESERERAYRFLSSKSVAFFKQKLSGSAPLLAGASQADALIEKIIGSGSGKGSSCLFCGILTGHLPGTFLYRDEKIAAFMDLYPITPGHLLVIPTKHAVAITDVAPETAASMMTKAQMLGKAIMHSDLDSDGFNLFITNGGVAGQQIFHVHLHVIPRFHGDGLGIQFPPGYPRKEERTVLEENAEMIHAAMTKP